MKNTLILLFISVLISLFIYYMNGCGDKATNPPNTPECKADTTILMTDGFGNVLGGDTTDWCFNDSGGVLLGAAYPNPTIRSCNIRIYEPLDDTVMLYFLKTCYDTTVVFKGPARTGTTTIFINDSTNQYANTYQRLYFKSKHFSSSQYCRFYGDIKFAE
ncbi:MAG: hypothetical protein ACHQJ4_05655 [Ignavibacteria bacterium]